MSYPELSILIPAAGASQRLGKAKQLVRYKSGTLIQRIVDTAYSIEPREVIVVTGANATAVKDQVQASAVRWVHNPDWSKGMGGSIAAGAEMIDPASSAVMVLLCDQWRLEPLDLRMMTDTWQRKSDRIVCARADGLNMPPVIFPASFFGRLSALESESGARNLLKQHPDLLVPVNIKNAGFDLDTQSQLNQLNNADL
jgi:molybdenum cofactor cytidylyltransferase